MDFSKTRVLCVGDIMLDRFAYCETERVSPEAPVPVLRLQETRSMLGGAGNVARNIAALGGQAVLVGLVGRDAAGAEVARLVAATPGIVAAYVDSPARPTICKTRYLASHQQIVRVDEERIGLPDAAEQAGLLDRVAQAVGAADAVVLSDYGKAVLGPEVIAATIARARARGIPVYVDPKGDDFRRYRGATCITPNVRELALAARLPVGDVAALAAAARKVMREAEAAAILVTRSDKGMLLVEGDGPPLVETARAREVYDVSGAGDTVIAVLALAAGAGYPLRQAMHLANAAAGIVVSKLGTATAELDELMLELAQDTHDKEAQRAKHFTLDEADILVRRWKGRGLSVGFTNGVFDIVHAGHVALLAAARAECDRLIVALNSDASTRRLKGPSRPVNPLDDRAAVIAALGAVDAVVAFDDDTPLALIQRLKPDVLIKGGDYTKDQVVGAAEVEAAGGRVVLAELVAGHSTTATITRLRAPGPEDAPARQRAGA
jgi:D-beta-D-heptose 7-phosphate kinase/D-beta-D-heptose 1-phosphate adenosyltransferase